MAVVNLVTGFLLVIGSLQRVYSESCAERGAIRLTPFSQAQASDFSLGSDFPLEGRVDVCLEGVWGSICYYGWIPESLQVLCRQVGLQLGMTLNSSGFMYYGRLWIQGSPTNDNAPIHMRNVACNGSETELLDCRYTSEPRCSHYQDVGVACVRPDLLLIRDRFKEDKANKDRNSLWLAVGLSLGLVVVVLLILVTVMGLCMLVSQCPLRKLYYSKPDHDEVVRMGADS